MIQLLLKLLVPDGADTTSPIVRRKAGTVSGGIGICANLLLFAAKLLAGFLTGAVSITADA